MLVHEGAARTPEADRKLALSLAGVAGALNTAGFYAVGLYASNMTGNVSAISDRAGTGDFVLAAQALLLVLLFVLGAATATLLVRGRRRRGGAGAYAFGVCAEAILLCLVGTLVLCLREPARSHALVLGLSFALGVQNALVTKISEARVRATHITGTITDIGIELARWIDSRALGRGNLTPHDPVRLHLHLLTVCAFLGGGLVGILVYRTLGVGLLFAAGALLAALAAPALRR
jgi:uncharacterized membrane protein YoaK (UPF0700 family)